MFLHLPKAAGSSISEVLFRSLPRPLYATNLFPHWLPDPGVVSLPGDGHEALAEAAAVAATRDFALDDFPAILVVVRNPYDAEVSRFHFLARRGGDDGGQHQALAEAGDFEAFAVGCAGKLFGRREVDDYLRIAGAPPPSNLRVIAYESLAEHLPRELLTVGVRQVGNLPHIHRSERGDWRGYYSPKSEEAVYQRYRWLFDSGIYPRLDSGSFHDHG